MKTLAAKLRGHWYYYGIIGNGRKMSQFHYATCQVVFYWLNRRSQRRSYTWQAFNRLLSRFQVPAPRIVEKPKTRMPCQLELTLFPRMAQFVGKVTF